MQLGAPNLKSLAQLIVITIFYFTPSFATKLSAQLDADHSRPLWSRRIKKRLFEHLIVVGLKEYNMDKEALQLLPLLTQINLFYRLYLPAI